MKGTQIFKVILSDRHCYDGIKVFADETAARTCAENYTKEIAEYYSATPDTEMNESMERAGWIYYANIEDCAGVRIEKGIIE